MNWMYFVMVGWNDFIEPFQENFTQDLLGGNLPVAGVLCLLFFLMFVLSLRFSAPLMALIMIPLLIWVNSWAGMNDLLVVAGIMLGGIIGAALLKWYNKR